MKEQHPDLNEHTDQFIVRFIKVPKYIYEYTDLDRENSFKN